MAHQEKLDSILSYLDNVEEDVDGISRNSDNGSQYSFSANEKQRMNQSSASKSSTRRFIWDDWGEDDVDNHHMTSIYEGNESIGEATPTMTNSPVSTISPEPSRRANHAHFISPIDIQANHQHQQYHSTQPQDRHDNNNNHINDNQSYHSQQSSSSAYTSVTANAFREVQSKIKNMQAELDERTEEVLSKERELHNIRLAYDTSMSALEATWKSKNEDQHYKAQASLERQREFQRRLASDVDKLKVMVVCVRPLFFFTFSFFLFFYFLNGIVLSWEIEQYQSEEVNEIVLINLLTSSHIYIYYGPRVSKRRCQSRYLASSDDETVRSQQQEGK
jgi:hypothetical protein